ncbi:hypothetical protein GBF35_37860 [Nonomuraea phyllanthi]|uniref:YybH family protein n=1 Tax=Nonomuraea phyllanthi TaxID=2219224 RepID=UPI001293E873|nr:nuclear transport factor 2 family protein [Nonomuraea phyllanthi]QFY11581.1 hypothetical protein GBF35_37860 [Nonomuraea phyllanthi]
MDRISQRTALLLAAVVPALLVAGCGAGGNGTQAMKGAASPATPTDDTNSPDETETETGSEEPTSTESEGEGEGATPTATNTGPGLPRTAVESYFAALKSGNLDEVVSAFADHAVVEMDGEPTSEGTEAIRGLFKTELKDEQKATHTVDDVRTLGDKDAVVRSTSRRGDVAHRGLFLLMQDGGEWKITEFMDNQPS